jgi:hypothetical protein
MEMSLDFLSVHQLAGGRQPRRLLAGEGRGKEKERREPGQDKKIPSVLEGRAIMGRCMLPTHHPPLPHPQGKASCSCL